jgi:hypothetical protein
MRLTIHPRLARAAAAVAVASTLALPHTAAAATGFLPGVTDSSTGVLRTLERQRDARFVPGVTDSTTGVLRERERRGVASGAGADATDSAGSGFGRGDTAIVVAGVLAAAGVVGSLAVLASGRSRRIPGAPAIGEQG